MNNRSFGSQNFTDFHIYPIEFRRNKIKNVLYFRSNTEENVIET